MFLLMILLVAFFVVNVIWLSHHCVRQQEMESKEKVLKAEETFRQIQNQKEKMIQEKNALEKKAADIFTLYEMAREITKKPNEIEAFKIFKQKLNQNVTVEDCQFASVDSKGYEEIKTDADHFVFPLKGKKRKLGYLVFKGLEEENKEKIMILGHQFALALRRVKLYQEVEELAITDSLTGVHTRRYFLQRFDEELKRSSSRNIDVSFLMIDVDHFKSFNDKYGHLVGDQILKEVGNVINESVREIDIVGRYGGEEFCVVLPDTNCEGAIFAAERIRTGVEKTTVKAYDAVVKVTVSVGASIFPKNGNKLMELIDKADWALYRAKKKGRNCTCAFGVYE